MYSYIVMCGSARIVYGNCVCILYATKRLTYIQKRNSRYHLYYTFSNLLFNNKKKHKVKKHFRGYLLLSRQFEIQMLSFKLDLSSETRMCLLWWTFEMKDDRIGVTSYMEFGLPCCPNESIKNVFVKLEINRLWCRIY